MVKEVIWKDKKIHKTVVIIIILICLLILNLIIFTVPQSQRILFIIIFNGFGLLALWSQLIIELTIIFSDGILIGNISFKRWSTIVPKRRSFLNWKDIISIKLSDHEVRAPRGSWPRTFMDLRDKNGKRYECIIWDSKGFILALKKLNKYSLLDKNSKYK